MGSNPNAVWQSSSCRRQSCRRSGDRSRKEAAGCRLQVLAVAVVLAVVVATVVVAVAVALVVVVVVVAAVVFGVVAVSVSVSGLLVVAAAAEASGARISRSIGGAGGIIGSSCFCYLLLGYPTSTCRFGRQDAGFSFRDAIVQGAFSPEP